MKKTRLLWCIAALALWSACFAHPVASPTNPDIGFWDGYWHGFMLPLMGLARLMGDEVALYEVANASGWYDFGYVMGAGTLLDLISKVAVLLLGLIKETHGDKEKEEQRSNRGKLLSRVAFIGLAAVLTDTWSANVAASAAIAPLGPEQCTFWGGVLNRSTIGVAWAVGFFQDDVALFQRGCHLTPYETGFYATELIAAAVFLGFMALLGLLAKVLLKR